MSEKHLDENETPEALDYSETDGVAEVSSAASAPAKSGSGLAVLATLLALVSLGVASYAAYFIYLQQNSAELDQNAAIERSIADMQLQISQLQNVAVTPQVDVEAIKAEVSAGQNQALDVLSQKLDASLNELRANIGTSSQDWLMAEVEYLIRLANQRVLMEEDVAGAIALFESADSILRDAEGITAFDLRQQIAADLASLRAVGRLDKDGLFVKLGALIGQIDQLKQKRLAFESTAVESASKVEETASESQRLLAKMTARLLSLWDYRREGEVVKPILPPEEEYYLRQNLVLKLQLAQLGLLGSDKTVYETSLTEAKVWAMDYFDGANPGTQSFVAGLDELSQIDISRQIPDVSGSLHAARALMQRFHEVAKRSADHEG